MKENLKPCVYKLWNLYRKRDRVLFVERSGELRWLARLRARRPGAEGKPSLNRAGSQLEQTRNRVIYPCPG